MTTPHLSCVDCGSNLKFLPGSDHLHCEYCGAKQRIHSGADSSNLEELGYLSKLNELENDEQQLEIDLIKCDDCGAETTVDPHIQSACCPYCASPLVSIHTGKQMIRPKLMLPAKLDKNSAQSSFQTWIKKLWFAPNDLKKAGLSPTQLQGMYLPYWTYDAVTETAYTGSRGETSYVSHTDSKGNTRSRQHTRWYPTSGNVNHDFDDVLVPATESVCRDRLDSLEPWHLDQLVNYDDRYLSGHISEKYSIDLKKGFGFAKEKMQTDILDLIKTDIGGDTQMVSSMHTDYDTITFKHILLPVYVCAYRFKKRSFSFLIKAQTGEVQGDRPWSWWKIGFASVGVVLVVLLLEFFGIDLF